MNSDKNDEQGLVIIDYEDLIAKTHGGKTPLHDILSKAFGTTASLSPSSQQQQQQHQQQREESLGLIAIRNIPSFVETKNAFLPLAHKLANLPQTYLETHLTDAQSLYNAGWSHGKEKLKDDKPDLSKGSFYFNPVTDVPGTEEERRKYPASYPVNKWPEEDVLPQLEPLGKALGLLMKDVVALLAGHIDEYIRAECGDGYTVCMWTEMKSTEKVKGRLLYYFPRDEAEEETQDNGEHERDNSDEFDSWIGWHNDSGFLTALAGDIYVDHDTGEIIPKDDIDPKAGLYIQDRSGSLRQICIPNDCMAVQIGECLQIISGGSVVATPHCVRGADPSWASAKENNNNHETNTEKTSNDRCRRRIARISFPCFVDTVPSFPLSVPVGQSRENVLKRGVTGCAKVPPLADRWEDGMDFGSFLQKTFAIYYDWSN